MTVPLRVLAPAVSSGSPICTKGRRRPLVEELHYYSVAGQHYYSDSGQYYYSVSGQYYYSVSGQYYYSVSRFHSHNILALHQENRRGTAELDTRRYPTHTVT